MPRSLDDCVQNAPEREEYAVILSSLEPILYNLPPKIISIDGKSGVGKTTLGRFLAWRFNVSLVETDLFLERQKDGFDYRYADIKAVILSRITGHNARPVIVEGMCSLKVLKTMEFASDFHVRVDCSNADDSQPINEELWPDYSSEFPLNRQTSLIIDIPHQ